MAAISRKEVDAATPITIHWLSAEDLEELYGVPAHLVGGLVDKGKFPQPVLAMSQQLRWRNTDVEEFLFGVREAPVERLWLTRKEILVMLGMSSFAFDSLVREGKFPGPEMYKGRENVWRRETVLKAVESLEEMLLADREAGARHRREAQRKAAATRWRERKRRAGPGAIEGRD